MEIVYDEESLRGFIEKATAITPNHPVLIDKFLDDAIEVDVDALRGAAGVAEDAHPLRREPGERKRRDVAEHPITQPVQALEVPEEQHELFQVPDGQRLGRAVKRMRDRVRELEKMVRQLTAKDE